MRRLSLLALFVISWVLESCTIEDPDRPMPEEVFVKFYGGNTSQEASDMEVNDQGEFIIFGTREMIGEGQNFYLIKADPSGNMMYDTHWDVLGEEVAASLEIVEGGYLITGSTAELDEAGIAQTRRLYWAYLDEDFNRLDSVVYEQSLDVVGKNIIQTMDGNVVVIGDVDTVEVGTTQERILLAKYTLDGTRLWMRTFGTSGRLNQGVAVFEKPDNSLMIFGVTGAIGSNGEEGTNVLIGQKNSFGTSPIGQEVKYGTVIGSNFEVDDVPSSVIPISGGYAITGTSSVGSSSFPFLMIVDIHANLVGEPDTLTNPFRNPLDNSLVNSEGLGITRARNRDYVIVGRMAHNDKNDEMLFLGSDQFGGTKSQIANHFGLTAGDDFAVKALTLEDGGIAVLGKADFGSGLSLITLMKLNDKGEIKR